MVYRCRLCHYRSDKVTVVRHHVMAHLLYHPYRCPYCDAARSVKSSPINKHVRLRHPGLEPNFICQRDEELERSVPFASSLLYTVAPCAAGAPLFPRVHLLPHPFPFSLFPFFHWLYLFSSYLYFLPEQSHSVSRPEVVGGDRTWV